MAFASQQVSVATTGVTQLTFADTTAASGDPTPYVVRNTDATNPVYLGGPGVTSATGLILKAGESLALQVVDTSPLFAVATGAAVTVGVLAGRQ